MRVVLLGPQGAGKGTQAERIAAMLDARHIAIGDMVRAEIAAGSDLGLAIRDYNDRGELVPDEIIVDMVKPALLGNPRWILDGFPRDCTQAETLDALLNGSDARLDRVVALEVPDEVLIERLAGRRQSKSTGKTYHVVFDPPPTSDPGPFIQRTDDTPDKIRHRLEIYHIATEPLKRYYEQRDLLARVDASGPIDEVTDLILQAVDGKKG